MIYFCVAILVIIEWLEFSFFLYLAPTFTKVFFPTETNEYLIIFYLIFFISYIARPIGAIFFGVTADMFGRKKPLLVSALLLGVSTICIGLIPGYNAIGWYAPLLLLLFRIVQSFAISGECNNSALYLIEISKNENKIRAGSIIGFASSAGMFIGGIIALYSMLHDDGQSEVWRYVYILLGTLGFLTFFLRKKIKESTEFINNKTDKFSFLELRMAIGKQLKPILCVVIIGGFMSMYIYTLNIYFYAYMVEKNWYQAKTSLFIIVLTQGFVTLLIPIFSKYARVSSYKKIFVIAVLMFPIISILLLQFSGNLFWLILGVLMYSLANGFISTVIFYYMYDLLKFEYRCLITSVAWVLPATFIGGLSPAVAQTLTSYGYSLIISFIVLIFSLTTAYSIKKTTKI